MNHLWEHLDRLTDLLLIAVPLVIWMARWARKLEISMGFTKDVATKHLPHIYWRLHRCDVALALDPVERPDIVYVNGGNNQQGPSVPVR